MVVTLTPVCTFTLTLIGGHCGTYSSHLLPGCGYLNVGNTLSVDFAGGFILALLTSSIKVMRFLNGGYAKEICLASRVHSWLCT